MLVPHYQYRAKIIRIKDGDTFEAEIDLGLHSYRRDAIRVRSIDTPEKNGKYSAEREHAAKALAFTTDKLAVGSSVILATAKPSLYDRIEADVWFIDKDGIQKSLAVELKAAGMSKLTAAEYQSQS